jgi:hypothetical protein
MPILALCTGLLCLVAGCGKKTADPMQVAAPPKAKEAASQLEQAFSGAKPEVKSVTTVASQALKTEDYEAAIQSLQIVKERGDLTPEQGLAVHNSMISLEAKLISAVGAGDANAKRAYEQLKKARRN